MKWRVVLYVEDPDGSGGDEQIHEVEAESELEAFAWAERKGGVGKFGDRDLSVTRVCRPLS